MSIRYTLGSEADACGVGDSIVAHGRGIALLGCDVDFGIGITKDFVLATTGKNYREDSYNSYYHPTYGGGDFKYTYTMFFHNFFILIDLALSQFTHFFQRKLSAGSHLLQGQAHT